MPKVEESKNTNIEKEFQGVWNTYRIFLVILNYLILKGQILSITLTCFTNTGDEHTGPPEASSISPALKALDRTLLCLDDTPFTSTGISVTFQSEKIWLSLSSLINRYMMIYSLATNVMYPSKCLGS